MTTVTTNSAARPGALSASIGITVDSARRLHPIVWLYLIFIVLPVGFFVGTLSLSLLRILLLFTTVPLMIGVLTGRYGRVWPVDWLFLLHICWAMVAVAVNNPDRAVENIGSAGIEFLGGYAIARAYIRTRADFFALVRVFALLVVLLLPLALLESQTDVAIVLKAILDLGLDAPVEVDMDPRMGLFRAQTVFAHPIHYGLFCSAAFSLVYVGMKDMMTPMARYLMSCAVLTGVFLSLSSGALLSAILQIGLIGWAYVFRNVTKRWHMLAGICVLMYVTVDLLSNRTPIKVFMSYATFSAHTAYYRAIIFEWGMINVWDNPVFGLGLRRWIRPGYMKSGSVDNFWLLMTMRYGIPGFILLALGYLDALFRVGRRALTPGSPESQIRLAWMICFVGLSFTLATVHIWTSIYSFVFFLLGSGLWLATADSDSAPEPVAEAARGPVYSRQAVPVHTRGEAVAPARRAEAKPAYSRRHEAAPRPAPDEAAPVETPATAGSGSRAELSEQAGPNERRTRGSARFSRFDPGHNR
ncbi:MAG: O-antigen ligase family protein [Rhodobacteraceae bacterium]|nr:O-antigen ligase family protein [Paracoccaceae bacterium]